ncbi:MAG: sigma-70 family RNA polymerase sigma factor [Bacteroidota bacterium]
MHPDLKDESTYHELSDATLIEHYRREQDLAYAAALINRYRFHVYHHCLAIIKQPEDAEDLTQRTFEQFLELLQGEEAIQHVPGLLYTIAGRRAVDKLRRDRRYRLVLEHLSREFEKKQTFFVENPDLVRQYTENAEIDEQLYLFVEQLPEVQRRCVTLFYFEKRTYQQIADSLQLPLGSVKTALQTGKRKLRHWLAEIEMNQ